MLQQIVITTHNQTALRPLLEAIIENQKKAIQAGLARPQFERQYAASAEMRGAARGPLGRLRLTCSHYVSAPK